MIQPKYSPEEALERVKLMMKYDTSKTLNENKEIIFEQNESNLQVIAQQIIHASNPGPGNATDEEGLVNALKLITSAQDFYNINSYLKKNGPKKDIVELINYEFEPGDEKYVKEIKQHFEKLGFKVEITFSADASGRLRLFREGGFKITYTPAVNSSSTSTQPSASANTATNTVAKTSMSGRPATLPTNKTGMIYTYCSGTYKKTCKSEVIRKVQACLGMPAKYQTGNFGTTTQGYLKNKFPNLAVQFKDSDVNNTICSNTNQQPVNNNQTQSNQSFQPGQFDSIAKSKGSTFDKNKFGYLLNQK